LITPKFGPRVRLAAVYTSIQNLPDSKENNHSWIEEYCKICGQDIVGEYTFNVWGDTVHAVHVGEYPMCEFCDRLKAEKLTGRGVKYSDGREICGLCLAVAVSDRGDAEALSDTVRALLCGFGIDVRQEFELDLIDRLEMARLTPASGREAWGFSELKEESSYLGLVKSHEMKVYVLSGMPRDVLMRVLAHEMMHVWLFANGPLEMDHVLVEGSCEYAAYLALQNRPGLLARYYQETQRENEDLAYGGGFRAVSRFVDRVGVPGWLDYLRAHEQPPWR